MRLRLPKTLPLLPLLLVALGFASHMAAQTNAAVIDFEQALLATAEMQKAATDLEAKFKPRQQELVDLQKELQGIQQKLQAAQGDDAVALQNEGQRKQREAQRKTEDLQADIDFERSVILQRGSEKMRGVVDKLAVDKSLDLIVEASTTVFAKPALDITQAAVAAYNQAYPAAAQ